MVDNYQVGGCLSFNAVTYVRRQADFDLYEGLKKGDFCYVLNSPQMGKSSLLLQTMRRLQGFGVACVVVDLTKISIANVTPEQWYAEVLKTLWMGFNLLEKVNLSIWWAKRNYKAPVERFTEFLEQVILRAIPKNVVIFFDGIESVFNLSFGVDDFFRAIRNCYNNRSRYADFNRLTFAVMGVASLGQLIKDKNSSPFEIGRAIDLTGFQVHQSYCLAKGVAGVADKPLRVLETVIQWTGGQPFLTQKIFKLVVNSGVFITAGKELEIISKLVKVAIIDNAEWQEKTQLFKFIYDCLKNCDNFTSLLGSYQNILINGAIIEDFSDEQEALLRAGLVIKKEKYLTISNPIYKHIFNKNWVEMELEKTCPYESAMAAWFASSCQDESLLLAGERLNKALAWAKDKNLNNRHLNFLEQSKIKSQISRKIDDNFNANTQGLAKESFNFDKDEQIVYNHLISWGDKESPAQLLERCNQLFLQLASYSDPQVIDALSRIVGANPSYEQFRYFLNRCCHILINRWQTHSRTHRAIADLVSLFENPPVNSGKKIGGSSLFLRLQDLMEDFRNSEEYVTLKRLVRAVSEPAPSQIELGVKPALGQLICRYPYLYSHCLLAPETSHEHASTIRQISIQRQVDFEINLSQYANYLMRQMAMENKQTMPGTKLLPPIKNPTLLSDQELFFAVRQFVGKVEGSYSYQDLAQVFLTHTSETKSYRAFKADLYEYIIASVEPEYGKRQFNGRLYKHLMKDTFPECDSHRLTDFLIMRTCSQLFNFLVVANPQSPDHYIFIDLIANLGPIRTIGLLLKIVLLSRKVKFYLEKRFSILFNHYESLEVDEILWLVKSLENLNVAFGVNFGEVDVCLFKSKVV
ncbi:MAG TPA: AAA-like domain-containing protein [Halomicronema sp.]